PACRPVTCSLEFAAHYDAGDSNCRLRIGDRRALAIFSASPSRVAEIGADHVDFAHQLRALSHERRTTQRLGECAIPDAVALSDLEGEVAGHDVDLTAPHFLYKDAVFHRPEDFGGIRRARRDHRVRHPADVQIAERFATRLA